jgi:hypothetical protein
MKRLNFCCSCDCYGTLWSASVMKSDIVANPKSDVIPFHILTLTCQDCKGEVDFYVRELPEGYVLSEGNA